MSADAATAWSALLPVGRHQGLGRGIAAQWAAAMLLLAPVSGAQAEAGIQKETATEEPAPVSGTQAEAGLQRETTTEEPAPVDDEALEPEVETGCHQVTEIRITLPTLQPSDDEPVPPEVEEEGRPKGARRLDDDMADVGLHAEWLRFDGPPDPNSTSWAVGPALRARGMVPAPDYHLALGADLGVARGTGFAYDVSGLVGFGCTSLDWLSFGLLSGVGASSWSGGRLPPAWEISGELFVTFEAGEWGRLLLQARPLWTDPRIEERHRGTDLPLGDELLLRGTVLLAPLVGADEIGEGGLRLGVGYREARGARLWTLVVGYGAGVYDTL